MFQGPAPRYSKLGLSLWRQPPIWALVHVLAAPLLVPSPATGLGRQGRMRSSAWAPLHVGDQKKRQASDWPSCGL